MDAPRSDREHAEDCPVVCDHTGEHFHRDTGNDADGGWWWCSRCGSGAGKGKLECNCDGRRRERLGRDRGRDRRDRQD